MIYESLWRRLYGGWISDWWKSHIKWIKPRAVYTIINLFAVFAIGFWFRNMEWYWAVCLSILIEIFWSLAHGPWFDIGAGGEPDDKMKKRYNKMFYHYILDWAFPDSEHYKAFYDFCGMYLRYSWMLIPICFLPTFNFGIMYLGVLVAITYGICRGRYFKKPFKHLGATELAEFIAGGLCGLFLCI